MPPSVEVLKERLENRKTETAESIQVRLDKAAYEISFSKNFNVVVKNEELETACFETEKIIQDFLNKNES
jgi:guanylate kinase